MAELLVVTDGPLGMRYSCLELARRLAADGHRVRYAGPPVDRPLAEHHGLAFHPLDHPGLKAFYAADRERGYLARWRDLPERRLAARESTGADAFAKLLDQLDPDLVLLDQEMQEHIVLTAEAGQPLALLNTCASIWRRKGLPPLHTRIRPGVGLAGTGPGMALAWSALLLRKRLKALRLRLKRAGCDRPAVLRELARQSGFDLAAETDSSQWLIPYTYPKLPVLTLHAREFDFPHDPAPRVHYLGPLCLRDRQEIRWPEAERRRLAGILEAVEEEQTLIYGGFGSYFTAHSSWLQRLIRAVGQRRSWTLVLSLGGRLEPDALGALPANVHAFRWLPQLALLERADLAVVHGGINTIDECVLAGVPMLVATGGATDMGGNTARVLFHGIGLAADPRRDSQAQILAHLDRLLSDTKTRDALGRLRAAYRSYGENRVAERVIGSLLVRH